MTFRKRTRRGPEEFDILGDHFNETSIDEFFGPEDSGEYEPSEPEPEREPWAGDGARVRSVAQLDPVVMFGMRLAVERCWIEGVTDPHLVLAAVLGRAAELGVAVVDPTNLYDHPRLGPWLLDQWPHEADSLDGFAELEYERWRELGISPSGKVAWELVGIVDPDSAAAHVEAGDTPEALRGSPRFPSLPRTELCDTLGHLLYNKEITPDQAHRMLRAGNLIRTGTNGITVLDAA